MENQSGCEKTVRQLALFTIVCSAVLFESPKRELSCEDRPCKHNLRLRQVVGENLLLTGFAVPCCKTETCPII